MSQLSVADSPEPALLRSLRAHPARLAAYVVGALGMLTRPLLVWLTIGCDDARIWREHALVIAKGGVRLAYENPHPVSWHYNHPPLMGYWSLLAGKLTDFEFHPFSMWMKVPGLVGDLLGAWLVLRICLGPATRARGAARERAVEASPRAREQRQDRAAYAFAGYGLSLPMILVSSYHCNTDCLYASLTLLAMYLMLDRERPFSAGLAMAAALNVKLMPLFLVPPLLALCRTRRDFLRCVAGLSLTIIPYVPFLLTSAGAMYKGMVAYNSQQLQWGLFAFIKHAAYMPPTAEYVPAVSEFVAKQTRYLILLCVLVVSVVSALRRRQGHPQGYELGALAWVIFLVLTPGYGVQYAVCALPLLFVTDLKVAWIYGFNVGLLLFLIYTARMQLKFPIYAEVQYYPFPPLAVLFGMLAWGSLAGFMVSTIRKICFPKPAADTGLVDAAA